MAVAMYPKIDPAFANQMIEVAANGLINRAGTVFSIVARMRREVMGNHHCRGVGWL